MSLENNKMYTMPMKKLITTMSLPIIVSMVIQALYNIVDSMFVARYSRTALDAVSLCYPIQMILIAISIGSALSIQALLARSLGQQDVKKAEKVLAHGMMMAVFHSALFLIFGLFCSRWFLSLFSSDTEIIHQGMKYMQIVTIFSFGVHIEIAYERVMQATGNALYNMIMQSAGALTNIILDPILIFGLCGFPAMGITGAAIATVIGQMLGMSLGIYLTKHHVKDIQVHKEDFKPDFHLFKEMYAIAIPAMAMNSILSISTVFINKILAGYSTTAVSVYSIFFKLQQFMFMATNGISNAIIAIISFNYGAKNISRIKECVKLTLIYTCIIMFAGTILFESVPSALLGLFNADSTMLEIGIPTLRICAISFVLGGINVQICGMLQALDGSKQSLFLSLLRQMILIIPCAYILSKVFGLQATWWAFVISEVVTSVFSLICLKSTFRRLHTLM